MKKLLFVALVILISLSAFMSCQQPVSLAPTPTPATPTPTPTPTPEVITLSGTVTFHADMGATLSLRKILIVNAVRGTRTAVAVSAADGTFSAQEPKPASASDILIYAFYDSDGDGSMDDLSEPSVFLLKQNGLYSNTHIIKTIVKVSAVVQAPADGTFDFASTTNPPVLKISDRSFFVDSYAAPVSLSAGARTGTVTAFVPSGHDVDLILYHVASSVTSWQSNYASFLRFPVALAGTKSYSADTVLPGVNTGDARMKINTITATYTCASDLAAYPLIAALGQSPYSFLLYDGNDTTALTGAQQTTSKSIKVYFRDFDRTSATDGLTNDASLSALTLGYGGFFKLYVFVDLNRDGVRNPGEPTSATWARGDTNANGTADWNVDYDDTVSASYLDADLTVPTSLDIPAL